MKPYYQQSGITIYHGDCREILPVLAPVDLLLTDPPYGIKTWNNRGTNAENPFKAGEMLNWDNAPDEQTIRLLLDSAKRAIIWGANHLADHLGKTKQMLVWDKGIRGMHYNECEIAWCSQFREASRIFNYSANKNNNKLHPTQKPLELMVWCIAIADKAGKVSTILDPFMGSGTTLRAAKDLGRKAIGIEIEEKYCEIAVKRLRQEVLIAG